MAETTKNNTATAAKTPAGSTATKSKSAATTTKATTASSASNANSGDENKGTDLSFLREDKDGGGFTERQKEIVQILASDSTSMTSSERNQLYAELVSDNQGKDNKTTVSKGDGTKMDNSEMTVMQKTKLNGKFRTKDSSGVKFDTFPDGSKKGATKEVCGGTITYMGDQGWGTITDYDDKHGWFSGLFDGINLSFGKRPSIVKYKGVLGEFEYDTATYELAFYEATVNGNKISVPTLHYIGDNAQNIIGEGWFGATSTRRQGSKIKIPDGLKVGDYMFADTEIESMPVLPDSLVSAHGMFMNCKSMTEATSEALNSDGTLKFPSKLEDISWMFAGSKMTQFFGELGENVLDARCAAQDCTDMGWDIKKGGNVKDGSMSPTFRMPDTTKTRWLMANYCDDMFDNTSPEVLKQVEKYCEKNDGHMSSQWVDENGGHGNIFDRIQDGSYYPEKMKQIKSAAAVYSLLQLIDPSSGGLSGTEALTGGMATSANVVQGDVSSTNNSTWSTLLQTERTFTETEPNAAGQFVDRAAAFGITFGAVKGLTKGILGSTFSTIAGLGVAGAGQIVGFASKITPIIDMVAGVVGPNNGVGAFLTKMSDALKNKSVSFSTKVEELNVDGVFEKQQKASLKYAFKQMELPFGAAETVQDSLGADVAPALLDHDAYAYGMGYGENLSKFMTENGKSIARDGNLIIIAMTPEEELSKTLNASLMKKSAEALSANLADDISKNGGKITDTLKSEYSRYYMNMMGLVEDYSKGATQTLNEKYMFDESDKAMAQAGIDKVMRNTAGPVFEEMKALQQKYNLFTPEQIKQLDAMEISGMPKFSSYQKGQSLAPEGGDVYADKLKADRQALEEAIKTAQSEEQINEAYKAYYAGAYGAIIREAERQGVVLDDKGASAEVGGKKSSFTEIIGDITGKKQEAIKADEAEKAKAQNTASGNSTANRELPSTPSGTSSSSPQMEK